METIFQVGDPVQALEQPKGLGKVVRADMDYTLMVNGDERHPLVGVKLTGRQETMAFTTDELQLCKCKDRLPLGVSKCMA